MRSKYQPHSSKREATRYDGKATNEVFVPKPSGPGMTIEGNSRQVKRRLSY